MMSLTGAPDTARHKMADGNLGGTASTLVPVGWGVFCLYGCYRMLTRQVGWYRERREARPEGALLFLFLKKRRSV